jgi:hypothetical protein
MLIKTTVMTIVGFKRNIRNFIKERNLNAKDETGHIFKKGIIRQIDSSIFVTIKTLLSQSNDFS